MSSDKITTKTKEINKAKKKNIQKWPKVGIIILNWNSWKDTIECLESLYQIAYPNYDVIVVDNGSKDESVQKIKEYTEGKIRVESKFVKYNAENKPIKWIEYSKEESEKGINKENKIPGLPSHKNIIFIKNEKNYGFAEGNNIGIRHALKVLNPEYILLLNNDTVVDPIFLDELVKVAESDTKNGIIGAVNYYYDDPLKIWYSGGVMNWNTAKLRDITRNKIDRRKFEKIRKVDEVAGSSLLIKVGVINKIGLLYSGYFCYYEETEWCAKARKNNYNIYANIDSKVWHKVASSSKKVSGFEMYYLTRNRFIFMKRNATKLQFILSLIYFFLKDFILTTGSLIILHGNLKLLKVYYKAIHDGISLSIGKFNDKNG